MRSNNSSTQNLKVNYQSRPQYLQLDEVEYQKMELRKAKKQKLDHLYNEDYQPAKYQKALEYKNSRSYKKKVADGKYRQIQIFQDSTSLKHFGLGPYFFIEYMRRISWIFFLFSLLEGLRIYINQSSHGLSDYSITFSTYLINTTIGNYAGNVLTGYDNYIMAIAPGAIYFVFILFYFFWKAHYFGEISGEEENNSIVKPQKFCVQIEGLDESYVNQNQLTRFFSIFGPVNQVSLIRRFKNKLSYFEDLDNLQEQIKQEQLQIILGSGDNEHLNSLKRQKDQLSKYINTLRINPKIISAFIHFQYEKSKVDCLTYFNNHYLFSTDSHACMRGICCCCIDRVQEKYLFKGSPLYIKNQKVPKPEDINWEAYQIDWLSKFCRVFIAFVIILVFIAISCTIIGVCSIYINTHSSNCQTVNTSIDCTTATCTAEQKTCYCNKNLFAALNDQAINTYCGSQLNQIYVAQGIQYAVVAVSGITNFIFGFIVGKLVDFTRPAAYSSGLMTKTIVYTFFLIFNTVFLPILIFSNIYGFKTTDYVSLLTLISSDLSNALQVQNLSFYLDFQAIWYKNVSPIFTNYMIFDIIFTWVFYFYNMCVGDKEGFKDDEGTILQKTMNNKMTSFKFNLYVQFSYFNLIIFMALFLNAGIPALIPLAWLNLASKYITNRKVIQSISSKIEGLTQQFMSWTLTFIPIVLIICPIFGCWMLTANANLIPTNLQIGYQGNIPPIIDFDQLRRELFLPYFLGISLFVAAYTLFYNTIIRFLSWLSSLCFQRKIVTHPYHTRPFSQYAKTMNVLTSYNIRNNDSLKNAILNLQKYLVVNQNKLASY